MKVVYATTTSHVVSSMGHTVLIILGTHWPAEDPIVKSYPDLFSDDPVHGLFFSRPPVEPPKELTPEVAVKPVVRAEEATAGPGEKRVVNPERRSPRA